MDDHRLFLDGLCALFERWSDIVVVGNGGDARAAYKLVERHNPDLVITGLVLRGVSGISIVRELIRRDRQRRILVLTMHADVGLAVEAVTAGALGYALKHQAAQEIVEAIQTVAKGHFYCAPSLRVGVEALMRTLSRDRLATGPLGVLSAREREVFDLLVRVYSNEIIARHLSISVKTVETHRTRILRKLRVHSIAELIRFAVRHHLLLDLPAPMSQSSRR